MYMIRTTLSLMLIALQVAPVAVEQSSSPAEQATAVRIAEISKAFAAKKREHLSATDWEVEQAKATHAIREEVVKFVEESLNPSEAPDRVNPRLRTALGDHQGEFTDPPAARLGHLRFGRALVLSHVVPVPPHFTSGRLFGFRAEVGGYRLVATAGEEFEGHSMFIRQLPSVPGEMWLLVGGQSNTFNGPKFRLRVYSFDGQDFAVRWTPDDTFRPKIDVTATGFTITHMPNPLADFVTETYVTTASGVLRVR